MHHQRGRLSGSRRVISPENHASRDIRTYVRLQPLLPFLWQDRNVNWLQDGWMHPTEVELSTGHHFRPIRATDVDLDMLAVMGSRERLWSIYGTAWGWPPPR